MLPCNHKSNVPHFILSSSQTFSHTVLLKALGSMADDDFSPFISFTNLEKNDWRQVQTQNLSVIGSLLNLTLV